MKDYQHFPHTPHDRTYWMIQGVVKRPDGTLIRPAVPAFRREEVPAGYGEILTFLLKGYDRVEESLLLKAWVETIAVKSTSTVREFNLRPR